MPDFEGTPEARTVNPLVRDLYLGIVPDFDGTLETEPTRTLPKVASEEIDTLALTLEPGIDVYSGLALELERRYGEVDVIADAVSTATEPVTTETVASNTSRDRVESTGGLSAAVRLTRDAAFAWFKVLTGPAVVTAQR